MPYSSQKTKTQARLKQTSYFCCLLPSQILSQFSPVHTPTHSPGTAPFCLRQEFHLTVLLFIVAAIIFLKPWCRLLATGRTLLSFPPLPQARPWQALAPGSWQRCHMADCAPSTNTQSHSRFPLLPFTPTRCGGAREIAPCSAIPGRCGERPGASSPILWLREGPGFWLGGVCCCYI